MKGIHFYTVILGFASGILFRSFFIIPDDVFFTLILAFLLMQLVVAKWFPSRVDIATVCCIGMCALTLGEMRTEHAFHTLSSQTLGEYEGNTIDVRGVVVEEPDYRESSLLLTVELTSPKETTLLIRASRDAQVLYGDEITARGVPELPQAFEGTFGRTFAYPEYLRAHGILYTMRVNSLAVIGNGKGNPVLAFLSAIKNSLSTSVENAISEPASGLGLGLVLGEKRALGKEWTNIFRIAGLIHIVVLSGYNISIVAEFVMRLLSGFLALRDRKSVV